jgi:hypothetical protein
LLGFDEDPRPIWEIVDAARYVRWFARFAGLDAQFTEPTNEIAAANLSLLVACGVYGPENKAIALQNIKPTVAS